MLPKSKQQIYVGFDDGAKAVKYYNAETRKILTSRNFRHLNPQPEKPPEPIIITPSERPEGESGNARKDIPLLGVNDSEGTNQDQPGKRKRKRRDDDNETPVDISQPRKTRGIRTDYRQLSNWGNQAEFLEDPFDEGDEETSQLTKEMYAVIAGDELTTLAQAR